MRITALIIGLWGVSVACLAQAAVPYNEQNSGSTDCHGLGIEFSFGAPPYGWLAAEQQGRQPQNAPNWNVGCVYGYAWAQEGAMRWMPEIGLKYGLRQRTTSDVTGTVTIAEHTLYVPMSINLLNIAPGWHDSLLKKIVMGIGSDVTVALSSQCYPDEKPAANLLDVLPELSRFSGSFFISLKAVVCWGGSLALLVKLPANITALSRLGDSSWYPYKDISVEQVYAFRIDTTSLIEMSLGLDVIQMLEEE